MKSLQVWKERVFGTKIDLDNASYDCVDVSKSWAEYLYDEPWTKSLSWGNAKDLYDNVSSAYWTRMAGNVKPEPGWIFVSNGLMGGGYGHTGVVVSVDGDNFTIYQQDTFKQVPIYTGVFSWRANYVRGFLKPVKAYTPGKEVPLEGFQRVVVPQGVNWREAPNTAAKVRDLFDPGTVVDFKGWVRGESVEGNDIWFVGRYTGGYCHSSGFTDMGTHDLSDLNVSVGKTDRQVAAAAMNVRSAPNLTVNNVVDLKQPGTVVAMKGYVHGTAVDNIDVWFVTADGYYVWSGGFTNQTTSDLPDLTVSKNPTTPTTPTPEVKYPETTTDQLVTKVYNKKNPIGADYAPAVIAVGNGQTLRSEAAVALTFMNVAGAGLVPQSGYRSYATQKSLYDAYVKQDGQAAADTYSARPGYSEHQSGLAMDFAPIAESFESSAAFKWLTANGHKFGWILRYPKGSEAVTGYTYEPWHWRYVGVTVATDMYNKGEKTLEQYFGIQGGLYPDQEPTTPTDPTPTDPKPDPETPSNPPEVIPVPPAEAAGSATKFVTRLATQFATVALVVQGAAGILQMYTGLFLDASARGWITVVGTVLLIGAVQFGYKVDSKFKWPF